MEAFLKRADGGTSFDFSRKERPSLMTGFLSPI